MIPAVLNSWINKKPRVKVTFWAKLGLHFPEIIWGAIPGIASPGKCLRVLLATAALSILGWCCGYTVFLRMRRDIIILEISSLYLYWLAGTLKLSKVRWMTLTCPPRSRMSRLVTLDTPHASPLAPCVSHERSLCPATFGQRCGMCVQNICALCSLLVHMGAKLWPWPVSQAAADSQGYQVLVCHPVCRLGSFPVRWYMQNDHRCALVRTVTLPVPLVPILCVWGGQHWEKVLWTLAVEEVHTAWIFAGGKAPGGCGRVKFSLLITYFFDVPRKQVSVCQCEIKWLLKLWCYMRCTLSSLDSIIFTIVEKHFLPQVFLWRQENLFLLLSTRHLTTNNNGD